MVYRSSKLFNGYSTCFRQWRAESHCKYIHGYSLQFKCIFEGDLDERNWVKDFGCFGDIKKQLTYLFDHTMIVAKDDPLLNQFIAMHDDGIIQIRVLDHVGCEMFAKTVYEMFSKYDDERVKIRRVICIENQKNSASYGLPL